MTSFTTIEEPTTPNPPRFWWLKRILALSVLAIAAYAGLMKWWGYVARQHLQAEIDAIHSRGEPILIEDFAVKPVPDALNAALSLQKAASAIALTQGDSDFLGDFNVDLPLNETARAQLQRIAAASAKSRELVRLARFQPEADWNVKLSSPVMNAMLPSLGSQRQLANLISLNIQAEHQAGHDAEAIELARDLLRNSDAMQRYGPVLVGDLAAVGICALDCNSIRVLTYDVDILTPGQLTTQPSGAASDTQIRSLISELLNESDYKRGLMLAFYGERLWEYDGGTHLLPGSSLAPAYAGKIGIGAMFELDTVHLMHLTGLAIATAKTAEDFPTAKSGVPGENEYRPEMSMASTLTRMFTQIMAPSYRAIFETHFRTLMMRRVTALRLAIKLYQHDHAQAIPQHLDQLVPDYIERLPADPYASDGRTFGYIPAPKPFLYSVGTNGKDDGGDTRYVGDAKRVAESNRYTPGESNDRYRWDRLDIPFPLYKPSPATAPATDAGSMGSN